MEGNPIILAIGADFARVEAALVDTAGGPPVIETASVKSVSTGQSVYLDPAHLLNATLHAVGRLTELKPREARRIAAVSLIGRSPTAAYVSTKGPETPFILPTDPRAARARESFGADFSAIYAKVGLTRERCQIPFALAASDTARNASAKILTPKDYLRWALTGEFATDPLDAQYTFLYDLASRAWSDELCRAFGIKKSCLPQVVAPTALAGKLTADAARASGLKAGLPVACGLGDWGEYLGAGAFDAGDAFEHIGSTGAFYAVTDKRPDPRFGLDVRPHVSEGLYLAGRQGLPGGACLDWFLKKTFLSRGGEIDWVAVEQELEAAAAMGRPENVLFFPNLSRREGQVADAAFLNLRLEDDLTSILQGIMEGLFYTLKDVAEGLKSLPWTPRAVFTTGQIAFKHAPRRIRANIYGVPIHAGRAPGANVMAAALVGAVAAGVYPTLGDARRRMLNLDGGAVPDPATSAMYGAHFASWVGARNFLAPEGRPA
jgi:xylulokinase